MPRTGHPLPRRRTQMIERRGQISRQHLRMRQPRAPFPQWSADSGRRRTDLPRRSTGPRPRSADLPPRSIRFVLKRSRASCFPIQPLSPSPPYRKPIDQNPYLPVSEDGGATMLAKFDDNIPASRPSAACSLPLCSASTRIGWLGNGRALPRSGPANGPEADPRICRVRALWVEFLLWDAGK
jgi:hypothetical protein